MIILKSDKPITGRDVVFNTLECQILVCLAEECDIAETAKRLFRDYDTIHHHISALYRKTGLHTHRQLSNFAVDIGLIKYENKKVVRLIHEVVEIRGWKLEGRE